MEKYFDESTGMPPDLLALYNSTTANLRDYKSRQYDATKWAAAANLALGIPLLSTRAPDLAKILILVVSILISFLGIIFVLHLQYSMKKERIVLSRVYEHFRKEATRVYGGRNTKKGFNYNGVLLWGMVLVIIVTLCVDLIAFFFETGSGLSPSATP